MFTIEWKDQSNPDKEWLVAVRDIGIDGFKNSNDPAELRHYITPENDRNYKDKCTAKRNDPVNFPGYTVTCFEDVYEYVKVVRENTDAITIEERLDGSYAINHGKHRLVAAKLLGVENLKCKIRKYIGTK